MIFDRLEHAAMYHGLGPTLRDAFDFLRNTDISRLPEGKHVIDGERLFAIVQQYHPKPVEEAAWEAHRRYIDVQYVAKGVERIGYAALRDSLKVTQPYDAEQDIIFFDAHGDLFEVAAGAFAIFMPQDLHAPCLISSASVGVADVRKVVVKCRVAG